MYLVKQKPIANGMYSLEVLYAKVSEMQNIQHFKSFQVYRNEIAHPTKTSIYVNMFVGFKTNVQTLQTSNILVKA